MSGFEVENVLTFGKIFNATCLPGISFFPSGVDFDDIRDFRISDSNLAKLVCTTTGASELKCSYALDMF